MAFRWSARPRCDYPGPSAGGGRVRLGWTLWAVLLLTLTARVLMALVSGPVCDDAYYYLALAAQLDAGNVDGAFAYLDLNVYPPVLCVLHRLGLPWLAAGKVWGVVVSSLAVLPLFGWVRRMFDDRVALTACLLYAVHPELIEWSVEPVRDPTFWLLLTLTLYLARRATCEGRWRWHLLGGLTTALAIHTRSEGWLLLVPLGLWTAGRLVEPAVRPAWRARLIVGGAGWVAVTPLLIVLVNVTLLADQPAWRVGRLTHFATGLEWLQTAFGTADVNPEKRPPVVAASFMPLPTRQRAAEDRAAERLDGLQGIEEMARRHLGFLNEFAKVFEPFNLILAVVGLWWTRRPARHGGRLALFAMSAGVFGGAWILFDTHDATNGRYFLPIYLLQVPFAAIGLLVIVAAAAQWLRRTGRPALRRLAGPVAVGVAVLLGVGDALTTWHETREAEAGMGEWLQHEHGPFAAVTVNHLGLRAGYCAFGSVPRVVLEAAAFDGPRTPGEVVIVNCDDLTGPQREAIHESARKNGFRVVSYESAPMAFGRFLVFVRNESRPSLLTPES